MRLLLLVIPFTEPRRECCPGYHQVAALFPVSRHKLGHVSETTWEQMKAKDVFQPQLGCSLAERSLFRGAKWAILENWVIMVYSQPLLLLGADSGLFPQVFESQGGCSQQRFSYPLPLGGCQCCSHDVVPELLA